MPKGSLIVVALGGNAISRSDEEGNVEQQFANSRATARALVDLIDAGHQLVVTHGNGPQIGNFLLRNEAASGVIYPLPMEVAVAHVQGGMGFMIAQTLTNELNARRRPAAVAALITTVLVNREDPAFAAPDKPVGRRLEKDDAEQQAQREGWQIKEVEPGRYRRVVPSPKPIRIMEIDIIRQLVATGQLLVTCGGGGIPVVDDPATGLHGVQAVIDKDLASALLAAELGADTMMILTNVDRVTINYGKPDERPLEHITLEQARTWMAEGQFPPGSMGPKIEGAISFLAAARNGNARVIIGPLDRATDAVAGRIGTSVTKQ